MPSFIAPLLYTIGIIIAIVGGSQAPDKGVKWPDSVPIFIVGMVIALVGLVLWRVQKLKERDAEPDPNIRQVDPLERLASMLKPAEELSARLETLNSAAICEGVQHLLEEYILPLALVRQRIIDRLGMDDGAEILVTIAYGERMLNRTWSAAADGHLPEANAVFPDAVTAFQEAHRMAQSHTKS